ncbi:putative RNA methyltransferase [Spongiactinospora sp. TRM90649]|uniref:putative RNA methyltransferase n=1 Tax=Spongiactinospora sp. TRM90649 TaxID=3031114 RepID=UPI0023F9202C|nr:methyltransferase domain-containing protein [Spongiactinospora sp. TRM90649]MDF5757489.1 methyltransferase domain-containing protein [Spongiactinospora sp. TRM90649]
MLGDVLDVLACPVCGGGLAVAGQVVRCAQRHSFDVARQGYVSLLSGSRSPGTADTAAMVAARDDFLSAGHYAPLAARLAELAAAPSGGVVLDAGAGTGYYLAAVLGETGARGVALDISKHAIRRAARAHPLAGAVVADVWHGLPVKDASADVVINVFAPRNGAEFARVLRPGGRLVVVTPAAGHLASLVERLGLLSVDEHKERRVEERLGRWFTEVSGERLEFGMTLDADAVAAVVGMGPSAWHRDRADAPEASGVSGAPAETVTASFVLTTYSPCLSSKAIHDQASYLTD